MEFSNPALAPLTYFNSAGWPQDSADAMPWVMAAPGVNSPRAVGMPAAADDGIEPVQDGYDFIRGDAKAPVTLVVYGNYLCRRFAAAQRAIDSLAEYYGPRLLRIVFRHLPLR